MIDSIEQGVLVAIDSDLPYPLEMSGLTAFQPKLISAPAEIMHQTRFQGQCECFLVLIGLHQNLTVFEGLDDDAD